MKINLIGLHPDVSRAYEVAQVGNHSISFAYFSDPEERSVFESDMKIVADFYGIDCVPNGDLIVEICRPDFDTIRHCIQGKRFETMKDLQERIKAGKAFTETSEKITSEGCWALLKTASARLNFGLTDILTVIRVAHTIARTAFSKEIKAEHIAEAYQYRAILDNAKIYKP